MPIKSLAQLRAEEEAATEAWRKEQAAKKQVPVLPTPRASVRTISTPITSSSNQSHTATQPTASEPVAILLHSNSTIRPENEVVGKQVEQHITNTSNAPSPTAEADKVINPPTAAREPNGADHLGAGTEKGKANQGDQAPPVACEKDFKQEAPAQVSLSRVPTAGEIEDYVSSLSIKNVKVKSRVRYHDQVYLDRMRRLTLEQLLKMIAPLRGMIPDSYYLGNDGKTPPTLRLRDEKGDGRITAEIYIPSPPPPRPSTFTRTLGSKKRRREDRLGLATNLLNLVHEAVLERKAAEAAALPPGMRS